MSEKIENKACDFILFGASGDLARRKLLSALCRLEQLGLLHPESRIIGVAREEMPLATFKNSVKESIAQYSHDVLTPELWETFGKKLQYVSIDLNDIRKYEKLLPVIAPAARITISYFAVPPSLYKTICDGLAELRLCSPPSRIIIEKPIGHNLASSIQINDQVAQYFHEEQIYRIDHYLGKETVLNLLALRFANPILSNNWNRDSIDYVQIFLDESVGVEGRWSYYDDAGQLRDMVQNHLLQILTLIAMEPPLSLDAESIREEKIKILRSLRPVDYKNIDKLAVRGQYIKGVVDGTSVPGYQEEDGAHINSKTETFVALKVHIDNWRWAGVPFYIRTGKRLKQKKSDIIIHFKPQPNNIFNTNNETLPANQLMIHLQPDEGVEIQLLNKVPGLDEGIRLMQSKLDLSFDAAFSSERIVDAYERLLLEVMMGQQYLFVHRHEVEYAWSWIDSILEAWNRDPHSPYPYKAGTLGPEAALVLLDHNKSKQDG